MTTNRMTKPPQQRTHAPLTPWRRLTLHSLHTALLVLIALLTPGWAAAQAPGCGNVCERYGDLLLAPERDLIGSIRTLEKVARPAVGPRNTRGRWIQREVYLGPEAFNTTFYLRNGLVQRIELTSTAPDAQCRARTPWAGTITALEAWQGKEAVTGQFDTGNNVQQSVHWAAGDLDVSVYLSITPSACSTKVAFKKRDVKDASDL